MWDLAWIQPAYQVSTQLTCSVPQMGACIPLITALSQQAQFTLVVVRTDEY